MCAEAGLCEPKRGAPCRGRLRWRGLPYGPHSLAQPSSARMPQHLTTPRLHQKVADEAGASPGRRRLQRSVIAVTFASVSSKSRPRLRPRWEIPGTKGCRWRSHARAEAPAPEVDRHRDAKLRVAVPAPTQGECSVGGREKDIVQRCSSRLGVSRQESNVGRWRPPHHRHHGPTDSRGSASPCIRLGTQREANAFAKPRMRAG